MTDLLAVTVEAEESRIREAERKTAEHNKERRDKLSEYEVGVLTRAEFRSEWEFTQGTRLGIVKIRGDGSWITYSLSTSAMEGIMEELKLSLGMNIGAILSSTQSGRDRLEQQALEGERVTESSVVVIPGRASSQDIEKVLCELTFSISGDQTLVRKSCD